MALVTSPCNAAWGTFKNKSPSRAWKHLISPPRSPFNPTRYQRELFTCTLYLKALGFGSIRGQWWKHWVEYVVTAELWKLKQAQGFSCRVGWVAEHRTGRSRTYSTPLTCMSGRYWQRWCQNTCLFITYKCGRKISQEHLTQSENITGFPSLKRFQYYWAHGWERTTKSSLHNSSAQPLHLTRVWPWLGH